MLLQTELTAMHHGIQSSNPTEGAAFDADTKSLSERFPVDQTPQVGEQAPAFELPDHLGRSVRSTDLLAAGPLVISFYRGNWCPYCNLELHALQANLPQFQALGASMVAVSPELPDQSMTTAEKHALAFSVLSDLGNGVARRFGLVFSVTESLRPLYAGFGIDLPARNGDDSFELPIPATFVLDSAGVIRSAFVDPDYKRRMEPADIISVLETLRPD